MTTRDAGYLKACCATAYSSDVVALLLGDSYHPGGLTLTRHLADLLDLRPGNRVLDLAAGRGTSAIMLATERDVRVHGLDLSASNVALAQGIADSAGLTGQAEFTAGDAEQLPFPDASFDAVICECAWCTFPDKPAAAAEMARVLRPGGQLGITDVTAQPHRLPPQLTNLAAWLACVADARPIEQYAEMLTDAGLTVRHTECHDHAITRMIDQIEARLTLIRIAATERAQTLGLDLDQAGPVLAAARTAINDSSLGYSLLIASR